MVNTKDIASQEDKQTNYEKSDLIKKKIIESLEIQLKKSKEEAEEIKNITEKEIITTLNRLNKEVEKYKKFSLEKIIIDFLPIIDSIECSLNLIKNKKNREEFIETENKLKLICNLLKEFFEFFHIKKINNINVPFNPSIHEAMSIHYTNEVPSNQIVKVMLSGYILYESRLLRPAMVIVSKEKM